MSSANPLFIKLCIPDGLEAALEGLAREVLRRQPTDINRFAAVYFQKLLAIRNEAEICGAQLSLKNLIGRGKFIDIKENEFQGKKSWQTADPQTALKTETRQQLQISSAPQVEAILNDHNEEVSTDETQVANNNADEELVAHDVLIRENGQIQNEPHTVEVPHEAIEIMKENATYDFQQEVSRDVEDTEEEPPGDGEIEKDELEPNLMADEYEEEPSEQNLLTNVDDEPSEQKLMEKYIEVSTEENLELNTTEQNEETEIDKEATAAEQSCITEEKAAEKNAKGEDIEDKPRMENIKEENMYEEPELVQEAMVDKQLWKSGEMNEENNAVVNLEVKNNEEVAQENEMKPEQLQKETSEDNVEEELPEQNLKPKYIEEKELQQESTEANFKPDITEEESLDQNVNAEDTDENQSKANFTINEIAENLEEEEEDLKSIETEEEPPEQNTKVEVLNEEAQECELQPHSVEAETSEHISESEEIEKQEEEQNLKKQEYIEEEESTDDTLKPDIAEAESSEKNENAQEEDPLKQHSTIKETEGKPVEIEDTKSGEIEEEPPEQTTINDKPQKHESEPQSNEEEQDEMKPHIIEEESTTKQILKSARIEDEPSEQNDIKDVPQECELKAQETENEILEEKLTAEKTEEEAATENFTAEVLTEAEPPEEAIEKELRTHELNSGVLVEETSEQILESGEIEEITQEKYFKAEDIEKEPQVEIFQAGQTEEEPLAQYLFPDLDADPSEQNMTAKYIEENKETLHSDANMVELAEQNVNPEEIKEQPSYEDFTVEANWEDQPDEDVTTGHTAEKLPKQNMKMDNVAEETQDPEAITENISDQYSKSERVGEEKEEEEEQCDHLEVENLVGKPFEQDETPENIEQDAQEPQLMTVEEQSAENVKAEANEQEFEVIEQNVNSEGDDEKEQLEESLRERILALPLDSEQDYKELDRPNETNDIPETTEADSLNKPITCTNETMELQAETPYEIAVEDPTISDNSEIKEELDSTIQANGQQNTDEDTVAKVAADGAVSMIEEIQDTIKSNETEGFKTEAAFGEIKNSMINDGQLSQEIIDISSETTNVGNVTEPPEINDVEETINDTTEQPGDSVSQRDEDIVITELTGTSEELDELEEVTLNCTVKETDDTEDISDKSTEDKEDVRRDIFGVELETIDEEKSEAEISTSPENKRITEHFQNDELQEETEEMASGELLRPDDDDDVELYSAHDTMLTEAAMTTEAQEIQLPNIESSNGDDTADDQVTELDQRHHDNYVEDNNSDVEQIRPEGETKPTTILDEISWSTPPIVQKSQSEDKEINAPMELTNVNNITETDESNVEEGVMPTDGNNNEEESDTVNSVSDTTERPEESSPSVRIEPSKSETDMQEINNGEALLTPDTETIDPSVENFETHSRLEDAEQNSELLLEKNVEEISTELNPEENAAVEAIETGDKLDELEAQQPRIESHIIADELETENEIANNATISTEDNLDGNELNLDKIQSMDSEDKKEIVETLTMEEQDNDGENDPQSEVSVNVDKDGAAETLENSDIKKSQLINSNVDEETGEYLSTVMPLQSEGEPPNIIIGQGDVENENEELHFKTSNDEQVEDIVDGSIDVAIDSTEMLDNPSVKEEEEKLEMVQSVEVLEDNEKASLDGTELAMKKEDLDKEEPESRVTILSGYANSDNATNEPEEARDTAEEISDSSGSKAQIELDGLGPEIADTSDQMSASQVTDGSAAKTTGNANSGLDTTAEQSETAASEEHTQEECPPAEVITTVEHTDGTELNIHFADDDNVEKKQIELASEETDNIDENDIKGEGSDPEISAPGHNDMTSDTSLEQVVNNDEEDAKMTETVKSDTDSTTDKQKNGSNADTELNGADTIMVNGNQSVIENADTEGDESINPTNGINIGENSIESATKD